MVLPERTGAGARRVRRARRAGGQFASHPARLIVTGFGLAVLVGTALLMLPVATTSGGSPSVVDALFTSTSAVCVTGLATVDTGTYWSTFGQVVIMALMQVGGLGIMTLATLVAVLVSRRLGLRARLLIQAETKSLQLRDLRRLLIAIVAFNVGAEIVVATVLTARFAFGYGQTWHSAAYDGMFHAIASVNNAGLSLNADSMIGYVADPVVTLTIALATILGGLGVPVVFELARTWRRPRQWSVLTRLTLGTTAVLLVVGTVVFLAAEYSNPRTLGPLGVGHKIDAAFFAAVMPRSTGLNSVDIGALSPESTLSTNILMFIGGGSAGTAGGIKVTTFGLLAFVIWAEMRGENRVHIGRRRIAEANQRQALAIALMGIGLVMGATMALLALTDYGLDRVLFEATSAFGTVGLSTGITPDLGRPAHVLLIALMFVGRLGPLTLASALALREYGRRYEFPEERTIVG